MIVYIGADHNGFELKQALIPLVRERGYEVVDVGNERLEKDDDFPVFAKGVAEKVSAQYEGARGILICGSGIGMDVVANKFPRVRSALIHSSDQAFDSRHEDDANVLVIPARYVDAEAAKLIVATWLTTPFSGEERHARRLQEVYKLEEQ